MYACTSVFLSAMQNEPIAIFSPARNVQKRLAMKNQSDHLIKSLCIGGGIRNEIIAS